MKRFTFAVNQVTTHNMREVGNHSATDDDVTVEVPEQFTFSGKDRHYDSIATENLARSLARTKLADRTPGVQAFQPGFLLKVEDVMLEEPGIRQVASEPSQEPDLPQAKGEPEKIEAAN